MYLFHSQTIVAVILVVSNIFYMDTWEEYLFKYMGTTYGNKTIITNIHALSYMETKQ